MKARETMSLDEFTDLIREHQGSVRAFIRSLGAHADSVDDIAQEAFLTAWRKIDTFDPEKDLGGWVRGIARNILLNERSRAGRRARILSESLTEILSANYGEEETEERILNKLRMTEALRECMSALAENHRHLLRDRYGDNRKIKTLAEALGKNANTLRQSLAWIRGKLRICIESKLQETAS